MPFFFLPLICILLYLSEMKRCSLIDFVRFDILPVKILNNYFLASLAPLGLAQSRFAHAKTPESSHRRNTLSLKILQVDGK